MPGYPRIAIYLKITALHYNSPPCSAESAVTNFHPYHYSYCGYTLFPAAAREYKFFGDDLVFLQCGAPKRKLVDLHVDEELSLIHI